MADGAALSEGVVSPSWVGAALDGGGAWSLRTKIPFILGFLMLFDSWDATVIAYTLPSIIGEWGLTPIMAGWLVSAGYGGAFVGAILFGTQAERHGRLPVMRLLVTLMGLLAIACSLAPSLAALIAIRVVQGMAIGGALPVTISYVNEIAPTATRGRFFSTFQFLMLAGFGLASLTSVWIVPHIGWRTMYALGAIPLLFVPLLFGLPESPRWLFSKGRRDAAAASLARLGSAVTAAPANAATEPSTATSRVPVAELFSPALRRTSTVAALLWFLTALVSYGLLNWVPTIYATMFKIPIQQALSYNAYVSIAVFILPVVLGLTIDRFGRRPPVLIGTTIGGIALLTLLAVPTSAWALAVSLVIIGQIGISVGSILLWPWSAETFDTRIRATALGTMSSLARAASMLTPPIVGGLMQATGSVTLVFLLFGTASLIVALLWWRGTQETAGRVFGD
jgi:putative MFS transporter